MRNGLNYWYHFERSISIDDTAIVICKHITDGYRHLKQGMTFKRAQVKVLFVLPGAVAIG